VWEEVQRANIENTITSTGKILPSSYVDVGAQVSGQLKSLRVNVGDTVHAGDTVAVIDAEVQVATVEGMEADLERLEAELEEQEYALAHARSKVERDQRLSEADTLAQAQVELSRRDYNVLNTRVSASKARIKQTQASLRAERAKLRHSDIVAPMSGTVVSVDAKAGQTINANYDTPVILRIADLRSMSVSTSVSEADIVKLHEGMPVWFTTLGDPKKKWTSNVKAIMPAPQREANEKPNDTSQATKAVMYQVVFNVENQQNKLRPEMTAQVSFVLASKDRVLLAPVAGLLNKDTDATQNEVLLYLPGGNTRVQNIETGIRTRFNVEALTGLKEGDKVITGQAPQAEASLVRLIP
jgi:macrolide-specific efflux system membrane fusion protein